MGKQNIQIFGFIPARAESSRFPGKPLADIQGVPMVVRVLRQAQKSTIMQKVYIATDSQEILATVESHGGQAILTGKEHKSGTDRIAEAARKVGLKDDDIVVNIQGDQPTLDPSMIEEVVHPLLDNPQIPMSTLIYKIVRDVEITHTNAVKTVFDSEGFAIYFSRATIPYYRSGRSSLDYYKHHGIYAYRHDFLQVFNTLPPGPLELAEGLEQLRALENGYRVKIVITSKDSIEVDTPEDLERARSNVEKEELTSTFAQ